MLKGSILAYFSKKLRNQPLIFRVLGRKTRIVWKFLRNLWNYLMKKQWKSWILTSFGRLLPKIEPSEITSLFYNNFLRFRGGGVGVFPLGYATEWCSFLSMKQESKNSLEDDKNLTTISAEAFVMGERRLNAAMRILFRRLKVIIFWVWTLWVKAT